MSKCSEIESQISQYKSQIDAAFQEISRIRGLIASATSFDELQELSDRRSNAVVQSNRAGNALAGLLSAAQAAKCGSALESRINSELNYHRQVSRQGNELGGTIAQKQQTLQTENATKENNAGTGTPGTAGEGEGATPDADELEEVEVSSKKKPEPVDPLTEPIETGPIELTPPKINTGDDLTVDEPELQDAGVVDVDEPDIDLGGDITDEEIDEFLEEDNQNTAAGVKKAQAQAVLKDTTNFEAKKDWRVRLSLSPGANYLYKAANPGILAPLKVTDGILFPYTPTISVSYNAQYDQTQLTHNNYKYYQYVGSNVDNINITCDFTAQDTFEANYLLAVIHFFRSATKMFYGQDENPKPGTPPPLCYLFGMGEFQFNAHPLAVVNFQYSLPNNVDYIRAGDPVAMPGQNRNSPPIKAPEKPKNNVFDAIVGAVSQSRLVQGIAKLGGAVGLELIPGGGIGSSSPIENTGFNSLIPPGTNEPTYVPTSIQLSITCVPIVSRYDISNEFSLDKYATGELLRGIKRSGGGIW